MAGLTGDIEPLGDVRSSVGEAPLWWAEESEVWWVDVHSGLLHTLPWGDAQPASSFIANRLTFAIPRPDGTVLIGYRDGIQVRDAKARRVLRDLAVEPDKPFTRLNDGKCDPIGDLWFGTLDRKGEIGRAALYRMDASPSIEGMIGNVSISNGLGWSPDGTRFYFIDSRNARIDVFQRDPLTGAIDGRRVLTMIEEGLPDGLTVDIEGYVWVALYGAARVHRYSPTGQLDHIVELPVRFPTSCEFGGPDLDHLLITTSYAQLGRTQEDGPLDGRLFRLATDTMGLPPAAGT